MASYYLPELGETAADAVEFDGRHCSFYRGTAIVAAKHLLNRMPLNPWPVIIALIVGKRETRWAVYLEMVPEFTATKIESEVDDESTGR